MSMVASDRFILAPDDCALIASSLHLMTIASSLHLMADG
jgi:hypothetical protein